MPALSWRMQTPNDSMRPTSGLKRELVVSRPVATWANSVEKDVFEVVVLTFPNMIEMSLSQASFDLGDLSGHLTSSFKLGSSVDGAVNVLS